MTTTADTRVHEHEGVNPLERTFTIAETVLTDISHDIDGPMLRTATLDELTGFKEVLLRELDQARRFGTIFALNVTLPNDDAAQQIIERKLIDPNSAHYAATGRSIATGEVRVVSQALLIPGLYLQTLLQGRGEKMKYISPDPFHALRGLMNAKIEANTR